MLYLNYLQFVAGFAYLDTALLWFRYKHNVINTAFSLSLMVNKHYYKDSDGKSYCIAVIVRGDLYHGSKRKI